MITKTKNPLFDMLYTKEDIIEYRMIPNRGENIAPISIFCAGGEYPENIESLNKDYNIYFGVNPRKGNSRKQISRIPACFVDIDLKNHKPEHIPRLREKANSMGLYPTVRVNSGHGEHWYWVLDCSPPPEAWKNAQKLLQKLCGGDSMHDLPRILRVPGTNNIKNRTAIVPCQIAETTGLLYNLFDFLVLEEDKPSTLKNNGVNLDEVVIDVLSQTSGVCDRYDDFIKLAMAFKSIDLPYEKVDCVFRQSTNYNLEQNKKLYDGLKPERITMKTAYFFAEKNNSSLLREKIKKIDRAEGSKKEKRSFLCTDLGNGQRMAHKFGNNLRHTLHWDWLVWDGKRWKKDETHEVAKISKKTALSIFDEAESKTVEEGRLIKEIKAKTDAGQDVKFEESKLKTIQKQVKKLNAWAMTSQGDSRMAAMVRQAQSEDLISSHQSMFDTQKTLINLDNYTVDLESGLHLKQSRDHYITRIAGAKYDSSAKCPIWLSTLNDVFGGDEQTISFVQKAMGYSMTGLTDEQCLFFLYGSGRNGKSTVIGVFLDLMGEYALKTPAETLYSKNNQSVPNDIARLANVRVVVASELEERKLNEGLIKDLTGGDRLSARFLHKEFFDFTPQFKLWMYGNHKPVIKGTDEGIWRRIKLIPFKNEIPKSKQDKKLPQKLKKELPGIFNWAVEGYKNWEKEGLGEAEAINLATQEYRAEMDVLGSFMDEKCDLIEKAMVSKSAFYTAYSDWCSRSGENVLSKKALSSKMKERGFKEKRSNAIRFWCGIGLIQYEENWSQG